MPRMHCDLRRAKISILYLLDHIIHYFEVISENTPPFCCLCRVVVLAGPSQKSKVLRNDCRSTVGFILWQELDESMAPAHLAQSRSLWGTSSTFSAWKEGNFVCNICCCLLTEVLQHVFHTPSQKSIPRWCVWRVVTFFLVFMNFGYLESDVAMNCCVKCKRKRGRNCLVYSFLSKEAEARSCFVQIWQHHTVMGWVRKACSKANQLFEPLSWQRSLINPRPHFSWGNKHEEGITSIMEALRKCLGLEEILGNTFTVLERMQNGCDHQFHGPTALWKLVPRRAHDPFSGKAVNVIGIGLPTSLQTQMESCSSGNFSGPCPQSICGNAMVRWGGQEDRCLVYSVTPALNGPWSLSSPCSTWSHVQKNSADSAVSTLTMSGLKLDGHSKHWWQDNLFHEGWRGCVCQSGPLAGSPALRLNLLTSTAPVTVVAES